MDGFGDVEDGFRIVYVAFEGCVAQQEMVQDQPGDGFGFFHVQAELRADLGGYFCTEYGVVAAAAFGDIVQEHCHVEGAAGLQVFYQTAGDWGYVCEFAALQGVQDADRLDRVLVDGEDVVGVELHLAYHAGPVWQHAADYAGLVEDGEPVCAVRAAVRVLAAEQVEEDFAGFRVVAEGDGGALVADEGAYGERVEFEAAGAGQM